MKGIKLILFNTIDFALRVCVFVRYCPVSMNVEHSLRRR